MKNIRDISRKNIIRFTFLITLFALIALGILYYKQLMLPVINDVEQAYSKIQNQNSVYSVEQEFKNLIIKYPNYQYIDKVIETRSELNHRFILQKISQAQREEQSEEKVKMYIEVSSELSNKSLLDKFNEKLNDLEKIERIQYGLMFERAKLGKESLDLQAKMKKLKKQKEQAIQTTKRLLEQKLIFEKAGKSQEAQKHQELIKTASELLPQVDKFIKQTSLELEKKNKEYDLQHRKTEKISKEVSEAEAILEKELNALDKLNWREIIYKNK